MAASSSSRLQCGAWQAHKCSQPSSRFLCQKRFVLCTHNTSGLCQIYHSGATALARRAAAAAMPRQHSSQHCCRAASSPSAPHFEVCSTSVSPSKADVSTRASSDRRQRRTRRHASFAFQDPHPFGSLQRHTELTEPIHGSLNPSVLLPSKTGLQIQMEVLSFDLALAENPRY